MAEKGSGKKADPKTGGKKPPVQDKDDQKERDMLGDWNKLNQNPPHVGPLKKHGDSKGEKG